MNEFASEPRQILDFALDTARKHGATNVDALLAVGTSSEVTVRLGETEQIKRSRQKGIGIRVFRGNSSATTSTSDLNRTSLDELIARTCDAAKVTAADPFAGLPEKEAFADPVENNLDLYDPAIAEMTVEKALDMAKEVEATAIQFDERVTNSDGGQMSWGESELHFANSLGTYRHRRTGSAALWTTPVVEANGEMQRDYWSTWSRYMADMKSPEEVGKIAAERALRRLGARKPETCQVPVVFEAPMASRLLGSLGSAILGSAVYRKASFLCESLESTIAAPSIHIVDNPHIPRGPASKAFDGEGLATHPHTIVDEGRLKTFILDTYTGRKLGFSSTRHASRGLGGNPSPSTTNFWMAPGDSTQSRLLQDIQKGVLITDLFGFGVNVVTGDYSQGAVGIWIENGELTYPVCEFTIASQLQTIWKTIDGIADDRDPRRAVSAPSFRVPSMTVAGN